MESEFVPGIVAAIIGGCFTIAGAVIQVRANRNRIDPELVNSRMDNTRQLTAFEIEAMSPPLTVPEQLSGPQPESLPEPGMVSARLVFAGSSRFRSHDEEGFSVKVSIWYSSVGIFMDGKRIGSGSGEDGFQITLVASPGRHTLVFSLNGEKERTSERGSACTDLSERVEVICWFIRPGVCTIHLNEAFDIDYVEPAIVLPRCYACTMPGSAKCICGNRYCAEHAAILKDVRSCLSCRNNAKRQLIRYTLAICWATAIIAFSVALYSYFTRS